MLIAKANLNDLCRDRYDIAGAIEPLMRYYDVTEHMPYKTPAQNIEELEKLIEYSQELINEKIRAKKFFTSEEKKLIERLDSV